MHWERSIVGVRHPNRLAVYEPTDDECRRRSSLPVAHRRCGRRHRAQYAPARPAGAPERLSQGQDAMFWTDVPFVVKSQDAEHPFTCRLHESAATADPAMGRSRLPGRSGVRQCHSGESSISTDTCSSRICPMSTPAWSSFVGTRARVPRCESGLRRSRHRLAADQRGGRFQYAYVNMVRRFGPQSFPAGLVYERRT